MKMTTEILKSIGIMFIVLLIVASYLETGDATAISMYFVVFAIPLILVSILNGGWLNQIEKLKKKAKIKRGLSLIPVLILIILAFMKELQMPYFDGTIGFLGIIGGVGILINSLIWNYHRRCRISPEIRRIF